MTGNGNRTNRNCVQASSAISTLNYESALTCVYNTTTEANINLSHQAQTTDHGQLAAASQNI